MVVCVHREECMGLLLGLELRRQRCVASYMAGVKHLVQTLDSLAVRSAAYLEDPT